MSAYDFFHTVRQGVQVLPIEDHIIVIRIPRGSGEIIGSEIFRILKTSKELLRQYWTRKHGIKISLIQHLFCTA